MWIGRAKPACGFAIGLIWAGTFFAFLWSSVPSQGQHVPACTSDALSSLRLQLQRGDIACGGPDAPAAYAFHAEGKTRKVGKAALILPFELMAEGQRVEVRGELFLPPDSPANSILILDAECKHCGLPGNPGLRVYFRDGTLRVDRKKIGEKHAWAPRGPHPVPKGEWVPIEWTLDLGTHRLNGRSVLSVGGEVVLDSRGRTIPQGPRANGIDRIQIGVTANSNPGPVTLYFRNISVMQVR